MLYYFYIISCSREDVRELIDHIPALMTVTCEYAFIKLPSPIVLVFDIFTFLPYTTGVILKVQKQEGMFHSLVTSINLFFLFNL